jgi:Uma2 family endonuclease
MRLNPEIHMSSVLSPRKTLEDLAKVDGKAELVQGRIIHLMPTGDYPSEIAQEIYVSLRGHAKKTKKGIAKGDNVGYAVPELASGRESFSPDASYFEGPRPPRNMSFISGAPRFAAEVRSEYSYGDSAEEEIAAKRADYFEAGTLVVWDVDPRAEVIRVYRASDPSNPTVFRRGDVADAEPAVPGWRIPVDQVFDVD